jgi:MerR family transcriptional regulator, copper efflux regulator
LTFESSRRLTVGNVSTMRISQLAERADVPATTLRFYETAGLLPAERTAAGHRVYGEDAVDRLAFIGAAKHLGLPLEEIAGLLGVWEASACADVKADLRPRIAARLAEARRRSEDLSAFTASLQSALEHLDLLPDRSGPCDPQCRFLGENRPRHPVEVTLPLGRPAAQDRRRTEPAACSPAPDGPGNRAGEWQALLQGATRTPIPDGLRLTMPKDRAADVAGLAAAEQECCPFFDFRLHLDGQSLHLEVRAPAAGAVLLAELFDPAV